MSLALTLFVVVAATVGAAAETTQLYAARRVAPGWSRLSTTVNPDATLQLTVGLHQRNLNVLDKLFWDVSNPRSKNYGNHLTSEEMRKLISPGTHAVNTVKSWLKEHGLSVDQVTAHEDWIQATGTLKQIERLLSVRFENYREKKTGRVLARALGAVTVPSAIGELVQVVSGHGGFPLPRRARRVSSSETSVDPELLAKVYNLTEFPAPPTSGKLNAQAFAQFQAEYTKLDDLALFCKKYATNCPNCNCSIAKFVGNNDPREPGEESELDSQYIMAMSHGAETWVYSYPNMDFCGDLITWAANVFTESTGNNFPNVISMSYGSQSYPNMCQGPDVARLGTDAQKMGTLGISVIIASGDYGAGEGADHLSPSFPSDIPYVTAVGATTFIRGNSGTERSTSWSGGGFSWSFDTESTFSYQESAIQGYFKSGVVLPKALYNKGGRGTPDVSLLGEGFHIIEDGKVVPGVAGTSCSTPSFAGLVTLLNNLRLQKGKVLGFLNPLIYQNPQVFTDITDGYAPDATDNQGYHATKGWDPLTGLGTPNVGLMMDLVRSLP